MSYVPFGRRQVQAVKDKGFNPFNNTNNWTATFDPTVLALPQGQFEVQKGQIAGGQPGDSFNIFLDTYQIDSGVLNSVGSASFYKASDGEFIIAGGSNTQYCYLYFGANTTVWVTPPLVTFWLVYDPVLPVNRAIFALGQQQRPEH